MRRRMLLGSSAAVLAALSLTVFAGWWQVDGPGAPERAGGTPLPLTAMEFRLTDHEGRSVGPKTLLGQPSMIFFGFTYCPDVCPTTLSDISGWLDAMGDEADRLNVVFITVDPKRDTINAMADYVRSFHRAIRGWSGPSGEIERAAGGFRVIYEKVPAESGNYTMSHTASVFLFDAEGRFVSTIDYHEPREIALPKIRRALKNETAERRKGVETDNRADDSRR